MRIFIAGATGTLGLPLVRELIAKNYDVTGMTRTPEKQALLANAGARPIVVDALDAQSLEKALQSAKPDCVIDLLTAIPKDGPTRASHMSMTNNLRVQGTKYLISAAVAAGARRIVAESMIFAYGFGDHGETAKTEIDPLQPREATRWLQEIVDAIRSLEEQLLTANSEGKVEAIPLRFGLFYGQQSPSTDYMIRMVKKRQLPLISGANGASSWIHLEDAVQATVAAVERGYPGEIYNIVDDEPVSFNEMVSYTASLLGEKRPFSVPLWFIRLVMPYVAAFTSTRLLVSNQKAKRELGWQLQYPSYKEGLQQMIGKLEAMTSAG